MISYLQGKVVLPDVILTTNGVGYTVAVVPSPSIGENVELYITTRVSRDGEWSLYGFQTIEEQNVFEKLIKVPGVGPALGMQILRELGLGKLIAAISANDPKPLASVKGVGAKVTKNLLTLLTLPEELLNTGESAGIDNTNDIVAALVGLGFSEVDVKEAIKELGVQEAPIEEALEQVIDLIVEKEKNG